MEQMGFRLLGIVSCRKVNTWGKGMEDEGYISEVCLCRCKSTLTFISYEGLFSSWYGRGEGRHTHNEKCIPCFQAQRGRREVLLCVPLRLHPWPYSHALNSPGILNYTWFLIPTVSSNNFDHFYHAA